MFSHQPQNYVCAFCLLVQGIENENVESRQSDIIYKDKLITSFIASRWALNNDGHVLIIPNEHIENIYELPVQLSNRIHSFEIEVANALKNVYCCDGVSSRQHNEPAGNQDVWHYHLHIFPRYAGDSLYKSSMRKTDVEERREFANQLRDYFNGRR